MAVLPDKPHATVRPKSDSNLNERLRQKVVQGRLDRIKEYQNVIDRIVHILESEAELCEYECSLNRCCIDGYDENPELRRAIRDYFESENVFMEEYDSYLYFSWKRQKRHMK